MNIGNLIKAYRVIDAEDRKERELIKLEGGEFRIEVLRDLIMAARFDVEAKVTMRDGTIIMIRRPKEDDKYAEARRELN